MVSSLAQLAARLDACAGEWLRIARYVHGLPVTVTACIMPEETIVSALSHQLVGVMGLGASWGAHCGNQLVHPDELAPGAAEQIGGIAQRVGDVMRSRGYRGTFGLDLIVDAQGDAFAIEINPRFQTVVSLVQAQGCGPGLFRKGNQPEWQPRDRDDRQERIESRCLAGDQRPTGGADQGPPEKVSE